MTTTKNPALDKASDEQRALKAWEKGGKKGDRPATPNLDAVQAATPDARKATTTRKRATGPKRIPATVRWTHNGEPVTDSMNKLSTIAYFFSGKIGGDDVKRLGAAEFRKVLADLGVADPEHTTFDVVLPNGKRVGATVVGEKPAPAAKATAKPAAAKPAAKKATPAKKATRQVTPRPKAAAKRTTRRSTAA